MISTGTVPGGPRCCPEDWGGSHYHCAGCNGVTGMYGHYRGGYFRYGKWVKFAEAHMCCPDRCEKPEAHR